MCCGTKRFYNAANRVSNLVVTLVIGNITFISESQLKVISMLKMPMTRRKKFISKIIYLKANLEKADVFQ